MNKFIFSIILVLVFTTINTETNSTSTVEETQVTSQSSSVEQVSSSSVEQPEEAVASDNTSTDSTESKKIYGYEPTTLYVGAGVLGVTLLIIICFFVFRKPSQREQLMEEEEMKDQA